MSQTALIHGLNGSTIAGNTTESSEGRPAGNASIMTTWLWMICSPVILLSGTFGNLAIIAVLGRMGGGGREGGGGGGGGGASTLNMYLLALAVSDLVFLYAGLCRYWLIEVFHLDVFSGHSALCKIGMWVLGIGWNNGTYLLVALTLQRTLSVLWPHRIHLMCSRRVTKAVIGGVTLMSCLLLAHVPYGYDVVVTMNGTTAMCGHGSYAYYAFNAEIWAYVEIVTFSLFPFLCLIVSNGILAWKLSASLREAKHSLAVGPSAGQVAAREKTVSSTTATVMVMSFVFIILNLPLFVLLVVNSSHNLDAPEDTREEEQEFGDLDYFIQGSTAILVFCNCAANFYLYCLTGTRFRNEIKKWIRGICCGGDSHPKTTTTVDSRTTHNAPDEF